MKLVVVFLLSGHSSLYVGSFQLLVEEFERSFSFNFCRLQLVLIRVFTESIPLVRFVTFVLSLPDNAIGIYFVFGTTVVVVLTSILCLVVHFWESVVTGAVQSLRALLALRVKMSGKELARWLRWSNVYSFVMF